MGSVAWISPNDRNLTSSRNKKGAERVGSSETPRFSAPFTHCLGRVPRFIARLSLDQSLTCTAHPEDW
jgi:hypothetical protein